MKLLSLAPSSSVLNFNLFVTVLPQTKKANPLFEADNVSSTFIFFHLWISMTVSHSEYDNTSLKLHLLNTYYPIRSFGGVGALYNHVLYGFNGHNCTSSDLYTCST